MLKYYDKILMHFYFTNKKISDSMKSLKYNEIYH